MEPTSSAEGSRERGEIEPEPLGPIAFQEFVDVLVAVAMYRLGVGAQGGRSS